MAEVGRPLIGDDRSRRRADVNTFPGAFGERNQRQKFLNHRVPGRQRLGPLRGGDRTVACRGTP